MSSQTDRQRASVTAAGNWWQGIATGFDLETTGIDVRNDRIIQFCVGDTAPATEPRVFAEYVNPQYPIHPLATQQHGVTDEWIARHGNPPGEAVARLVEELARRVLAKIPIVGMNLAYDFTLLYHECRRWGIPWVEERAGLPLAPVVDIYVLDKHIDPYRRGSRKLADDPEKGPGMATKYGVTLVGAHDAVADTLASVEVARRIAASSVDISRLGLFRLHAAQTDWKAEQAAGLQDYFRRKKGQPDAVVDPCWPVCYDDTHIRT